MSMETVFGINGTNVILYSLEEAEKYLIENYPEYCGYKDATIDFAERMIWEDRMYCCDKCEEAMDHNQESIETRYGFICLKCAGH